MVRYTSADSLRTAAQTDLFLFVILNGACAVKDLAPRLLGVISFYCLPTFAGAEIVTRASAREILRFAQDDKQKAASWRAETLALIRNLTGTEARPTDKGR